MSSEDSSFRISMMEGMNKFQSARVRAFWQDVFNHLRGKPAELLSFDDIRQRLRLREESYKGLQQVPLEKIAGSVGRYRDFDANFLPRKPEMRDRWSRVYAQANSMTGLPPIELYKVGDIYFVRDGNHRVSVARQLGSGTIEAHVTELPTYVELKPGMSMAEIDEAAAYVAFLEEVGLPRTRPHHQPLRLSESSRYADLMGHIYLHKYILEQIAGHDIALEDAAATWYDQVYRPTLTLIRKHNVVDALGARTEADLYLWLIDHLRDLREQFGDKTPSSKVSDAMIDFLTGRNLPIPDELVQEDDDSVILSRTQLMRALDRMNEQSRRPAEDAPREATPDDASGGESAADPPQTQADS